MDSFYRHTWAEISLDALQHNLQAMREALPDQCLLMASVKANAYGHGAVEVAEAAERFGVDYLGVAFLDEALQLRKAGIKLPILVLGFVPAEALELARKNEITISLFREDIRQSAEVLDIPEDGNKLKVHIKIDSGMGRLGVLGHEEAIAFIEKSLNTPQLEVEGLFTHYAKADELDKTYTKLQYERFKQITDTVNERGWSIPIIHAANSAAGMDTPHFAGSMVRFGIGMYGLYPSEEVNRVRINLKPVLSLKTTISWVKSAPPGWGISYGTRYVTEKEERIGTLPIGYADGFSRMLSGKANGLIRGIKTPILGTICMDQCMISLESVEQQHGVMTIEAGEEVVLIGSQGDSFISVEEVAGQLGTIPYEVICMLAARVPRLYMESGNLLKTRNQLT
ncbi:alanine racemase [Paenibacillus sp. GSMTC-2017]|uniref:alanine racemase n=1 Tax=Paenibacillus sp. GSMTC-2017 TaxID=2794350 RepID=UPI0018D8C2E9|nr:alanine racemase [Paenibacillus sp. GSMTC-2017]MBH5320145.1 alanine racemase [Paenibacillus sp. GSMTC-2017]